MGQREKSRNFTDMLGPTVSGDDWPSAKSRLLELRQLPESFVEGPVRRSELERLLGDPFPGDHLRGRDESIRQPPPRSAEEKPVRDSLRKLLKVPLSVSTLILPNRKGSEGRLIQSTTAIWHEIVRRLRSNWSLAYELPPDKWEELVATAFRKDGFDEVILTPRSGDHGRDVIAIRRGVGSIKVIGSVKAYKAGHLVKHDDVRALLGVMSGEQDTSKGILTTTSDFAPKIESDPFIKPFLPTRLELMNGTELRKWLIGLSNR